MTEVLVVPAAPALLPSYAGGADPLAALRAVVLQQTEGFAAASDSVAVLGAALDPIACRRGIGEPQALRIGRSLLDDVGFTGQSTWWPHPGPDPRLTPGVGLLVIADGSACRSERAPGHLDERSFGFDAKIEAALATGDSAVLRSLDAGLGDALLAGGSRSLQALGRLVPAPDRSELFWAGDPYGVRYWVARWS